MAVSRDGRDSPAAEFGQSYERPYWQTYWASCESYGGGLTSRIYRPAWRVWGARLGCAVS